MADFGDRKVHRIEKLDTLKLLQGWYEFLRRFSEDCQQI
ncbi:MAG: hypothetical protein CLLPBCKN_005829 [Chroococcidiopsis cubana SAG 39.79]|nr:hypothetical protein [Chroococcidiopsis cubana SAG 39.79]